MSFTGILLMILVAAVVGTIAEALIPSRMPGGLIGAIVAGLLGAWVGGWLFTALMGTSTVGPVFYGIAIIPAISGAIVILLLVGLITRPVDMK